MGIPWKKAAWPFLVAVIAVSLSLGLARLEPARQAIAESATPAKEGEDGCCRGRHHNQCCSVTGGKCACGKGAMMPNRLPRSELTVELLAFARQDKEPAPPEKKATPEAKTLGDEISKAL